MRKRFLSAVLSGLMVLSSLGSLVYADNEILDTTDPTQQTALAKDEASAEEEGELLADNVRFVNEKASTNGNGLTADTPYNVFANAINDLKASGGTIVITGTDDAAGATEQSVMTAPYNTGDLVFTSVYGGVDYREYGAKLKVDALRFGLVENPGKITFDNIDLTTTEWNNWHLLGHETLFTDTCTITELNGKASPSVQLLALISTGGNYAGSYMPDTYMNPIKITINNSGYSTLIIGPCEDITIGDVDVTIGGNLPNLSISNNTWANYDHGQLKIDGDVTVTVNGTLGQIAARATEVNDFSLEEFNGNLSVIVDENGAYNGTISDHVKMRAEKWFVVRESEGAALVHGENGGDYVLTTDGDYNVVTLTNTTTSNKYSYEIANGTSSFTLTESGDYTIALSKEEITKYTIEFVDATNGNDIDDIVVIAGKSTPLPTLSDTATLGFAGWADDENATEAKYAAGENFTATGSITLYAVWTKLYSGNVRFVNANISSNGSGRSPESPYKAFASAATDLATTGGTIVVIGSGATPLSALNNTGDILVTSVYDGVDYRSNGAHLTFANLTRLGLVENPGKIVFDNIKIQTTDWANLLLCGHETVFTDTCNSVNASGENPYIQLLALTGVGDVLQTDLPDEYTDPINITVGNNGNAVVIVGGREPVTVNDVNITVDGALTSGITLSNNSYNKWWGTSWTDEDASFGDLTVKGDVKVIVNGTLPTISARYRHTTETEIEYSLSEVRGDLGVIVNHGGTFTKGISEEVMERLKSKWFIVRGIEGTVLSYGEGADNFVAEVEGDFNIINLTNTTTENTYKFIVEDGTSEFTLPESGDYTVTLSKENTLTISFVDTNGNKIDPIAVFEGESATLPSLPDNEAAEFEGWTDVENGTEAKYKGGEKFTVSESIVLYAVWTAKEFPEDVRFVNGLASKNGDGRTPLTPYVKLASAAADLRESGGTIVVTGKTTDFTLNNTGDIVITSVYDGIDYRERGASLTSNGGMIKFGHVENPGSVTMENLVVYSSAYDNWQIFAHDTIIKDSVKIYTPDGKEHDTVQLMLHATSDTQIFPDALPWDMSVYIGTNNCGSMILGPREELITGGYDITVDGKIGTIAVSNNTYEKNDWIGTSEKFGQLTIDGGVKITVNGSVSTIRARKSYLTEDSFDYGLKKITGSIGTIVNYGGKYSGSYDDVIRERTEGKWFVIRGIEGVELAYGKDADDIVLTVDDGFDYNYVTITNTTSGNSYSYLAGGGVCKFTIPESGEYTVSCSETTLYGIEYSTSPYDEITPESYYAESTDSENLTITLPTLSRQATHNFLGWTTVEGGETAEFEGGAQYTLTGLFTMYAVWEIIPTFTVTFKDDGGNIIHKSTGYAGAPISFPATKLYKYGQKLLGYAYEGTTDVIPDNALIPARDMVALPVWGEIPAGETRVYVNGASGNNDNDGTSPDKAVKTIAKAVEMLKADGGYIIVTDGVNALTSAGWNNAGDITLTSVDPSSDIDYRATKLSSDKLSFTGGAYITYGYVAFGDTDLTGKITIENVTLVNKADWQFLCFNGHPYEIGKGLRIYQQLNASSEITESKLCIRSLGESGSSKTNPEGIIFTLSDPDVGTLRVSAIGKAENTVSGLDITLATDYSSELYIGNDSQGGKTTVNGDVRFTVNGKVANKLVSTAMTYPINGNVYAACNNDGAGIDINGIVLSEGYKKYVVSAKDGLTVFFDKASGEFTITRNDAYDMNYVAIYNSDLEIVDVIAFTENKATYKPTSEGNYIAELTDKALAKLTLDTKCDEYDNTDTWYEEGAEIELPTDLYRYGYVFGGWSCGNSTYTDGAFTMPAENTILTAIWTNAEKHTVTFDANGSDITVPAPVEEYKDELIELKKVSPTTSTFIGWNEDKDAKTGVLNYTVTGTTTLYAINTTEPAYVINSYYRGDPNDYTGPRNSFRRYVIDVYLENAVASEGTFKLNTDNGFLYYLGHIPEEGISATVDAKVHSGSTDTPGLQYFTTPSIEFKWTSENPIDTTGGRIRVARIMMYFSSWGMGYDQIEKRTTDEVVSPFEGYTATVDGKEAYISTNFYKGVRSDGVKISGNVTLEGRENDSAAKYDYAKLYILDSEGDAVEYIVLENEATIGRTFAYSTEIFPGDYTIRVIKKGYIERNIPVSVTEATTLPEAVLFAGDTLDENRNGDGIVDIDDFTRILKGFSSDFPLEDYIDAIDVNEDGSVNVSDLSIIKNAFAATVENAELNTAVDTEGMKLDDWKITVKNNSILITGGSNNAVENAKLHLQSEYGKFGMYKLPNKMIHTRDYDIESILVNGVSLGEYRIVIAENDTIAAEYAQYIYDYIAELSGYGLPIVYDSEGEYEYEILVGGTARRDNPITAIEEYSVYEEDGKLYVFYGDEQGAEMAALDLCEKILGKDSEGYDSGIVSVVPNASFSGRWSVLSKFGVMSDSHVGTRYNWANYDWLHNVFNNFERVHEEKGLDFIVSLGDNIDDGYAATYAADYATYLEEIKNLDICDPVNPIDGRAEGTIPHYELCGNHDPIGGQLDANGSLKIRFFQNKLWYTENENGEKVAHIGFFTNYGGYPLHDYAYSGSYASYYSYGRVNDQMVEFVEDSIIEANAKGAKHIILYNHFGMSQQVGSPCLPETGLGKIADVCEKYGIKLYFNGHEHDVPYSLRRYNEIYDYDASMTAHKHAIVEITTLRAKVTIYNSEDNSVYRTDIVPLSGRGEAKQVFAK